MGKLKVKQKIFYILAYLFDILALVFSILCVIYAHLLEGTVIAICSIVAFGILTLLLRSDKRCNETGTEFDSEEKTLMMEDKIFGEYIYGTEDLVIEEEFDTPEFESLEELVIYEQGLVVGFSDMLKDLKLRWSDIDCFSVDGPEFGFEYYEDREVYFICKSPIKARVLGDYLKNVGGIPEI